MLLHIAVAYLRCTAAFPLPDCTVAPLLGTPICNLSLPLSVRAEVSDTDQDMTHHGIRRSYASADVSTPYASTHLRLTSPCAPLFRGSPAPLSG